MLEKTESTTSDEVIIIMFCGIKRQPVSGNPNHGTVWEEPNVSISGKVCLCVFVCVCECARVCVCDWERCLATSCCVTLWWLTAPAWLYNGRSLLSVSLYKHKVGWFPHAELLYWSLMWDLTAALIVLFPFLSCRSIALCVDFYPLTNHSDPLPLLSCQSSRRCCCIWYSLSGKRAISSK